MEEREVELIDYINVILKRKWLIAAGTLVCILAAAVYSLARKSPTLYEAKASLLVIPPPFKADLTPPSLSVYAYEQLARAQDLEQAVIDSLGLKTVDGKPYEIASLDGMLKVEVVKETASGSQAAPASPLITLSVKSDSSELSVRVVNVWADLFVRRNSGLSSRAVSGSYDFILNQYDTAKKRLEEAEDAFLRFKTDNPQVALSNERTSEAAKLNELQVAHTNLRASLKAKEDSLKSQMDFLAAVEIKGKWIGAFVEEGKPLSFEGLTEEQRDMRRLVINTQQELLRAERELREFNEEHRVDLLKAEVDKKAQTLTAHQTELVTIGLSRKVTQTALEQADKQLQQQSPVLVLSKAITDDALWQKARNGAPSPEDVKKLEDLKLRSEQINPVYEELMKKKAALQLEYDSYAPKEIVLKEEIEKLKKEFPALREKLQKEERQQADLTKRAEVERAALNAFLERYTAVKSGVERLRLEVATARDNLASLQSAVEISRSRVLSLDDHINLLQLEQARRERDLGILKSTFDRFAKLAEDARIAKAGESSDVRVVARAVEAPPLPSKGQNTVILAGAVGLMVSTFLAFLIEYVEKARQGAAQGNG